MFRNIFTAYLLMHLLGDFIFQTSGLSRKKENSYRFVLLHAMIYSLSFLMSLPFLALPGVWLPHIILLCVLHLMVDTVKYQAQKRYRQRQVAVSPEGPGPYLIDQAVHLLILFIMALNAPDAGPLATAPWVNRLLAMLSWDGSLLLAWSCMVVAVWKPANITVKQIVGPYKPDEPEGAKKNAGAMIGTMERLIMALFLGLGQYAAIGLVLTAKSVARFDMLKDKQFSEYYLLGTLLSTLFVLVMFLVVMPL